MRHRALHQGEAGGCRLLLAAKCGTRSHHPAAWAVLTSLELQVEDRPVIKERVETVQEHRPVEQEFVVSPKVALLLQEWASDCWPVPPPITQVETRATGAEREVGGGQMESLGTTERVVGTGGTQPTRQ